MAFRDECPRCGADLHVCRNCRHHDEHAQNQCREPHAEPVRDRERANRCDWFGAAEASASGATSRAAEREASRAALDALFKKR